MDTNELLKTLLFVAIATYGFATGLATPLSALVSLLRQPSLAARTAFALFVGAPLLVAGLFALVGLPRTVAIALMLLAISPGLPLLPVKSRRYGGRFDYAVSITFLSAIAAIVLAPVVVGRLAAASGHAIQVDPDAIARTVGSTILAPLSAGALSRALAPRLAERVAPYVLRGANAIWPGLALMLFVLVLHLVPAVGVGGLLAMSVVTIGMLALGHALGGPEPETREVLAMAAAGRFPGLALAIATAHLPGQPGIAAAILLYTVMAALVSALYAVWQRSRIGPPMVPA